MMTSGGGRAARVAVRKTRAGGTAWRVRTQAALAAVLGACRAVEWTMPTVGRALAELGMATIRPIVAVAGTYTQKAHFFF